MKHFLFLLILLVALAATPTVWAANIPAVEATKKLQPEIDYMEKEIRRMNMLYDTPGSDKTVYDAYMAARIPPNQVHLISSGVFLNWHTLRDQFYVSHLKKLKNGLALIQRQGYAKPEDLKYISDGMIAWHQWEEGGELFLREFIKYSLKFSQFTDQNDPTGQKIAKSGMDVVEKTLKDLSGKVVFDELNAPKRKPVMFTKVGTRHKVPPGIRAELYTQRQQLLPQLQQKQQALKQVQQALAETDQKFTQFLLSETPDDVEKKLAETKERIYSGNSKTKTLWDQKKALQEKRAGLEKELLGRDKVRTTPKILADLKQVRAELHGVEEQLGKSRIPGKDQKELTALEERLKQLQSGNGSGPASELRKNLRTLQEKENTLSSEVSDLQKELRKIDSQLIP